MANKLENEIKVDIQLGRDAEFTYTTSGKCIVKFSGCYNSRKKNTSGDWENVPNWFDCQWWHESSDDKNLLMKGNLVKVKGELRQEKWADKQTNQPRYKIYINVSEVKLLDKNEVFGGGQNNSQSSNQSTNQANIVDEFEDDMPF